jgi:hypothetical protein
MRALNKASRKLPFFELQNVESVFWATLIGVAAQDLLFQFFPSDSAVQIDKEVKRTEVTKHGSKTFTKVECRQVLSAPQTESEIFPGGQNLLFLIRIRSKHRHCSNFP